MNRETSMSSTINRVYQTHNLQDFIGFVSSNTQNMNYFLNPSATTIEAYRSGDGQLVASYKALESALYLEFLSTNLRHVPAMIIADALNHWSEAIVCRDTQGHVVPNALVADRLNHFEVSTAQTTQLQVAGFGQVKTLTETRQAAAIENLGECTITFVPYAGFTERQVVMTLTLSDKMDGVSVTFKGWRFIEEAITQEFEDRMLKALAPYELNVFVGQLSLH